MRDTLDWHAWTFVLYPVFLAVFTGGIALLLRWGGRDRKRSVLHRVDDHGLLLVVGVHAEAAAAEASAAHLRAEGVRATTATASDGVRVLVFPEDRVAALRALGRL